MEGWDVRAIDPAAHQLTKVVMEADMSVDAPPKVLGYALVWGGAERQEKDAVDQ